MTRSPALAAAVAVAALIEACPACSQPENAGLCHREKCQRAVLPLLKQSALAKGAAPGKYHEVVKLRPTEKDAATLAAERRNERKRQRLEKALAGAGEFTRVKRAA